MSATKIIIALTAMAPLTVAGSANAGEFQSNGRTAAVRYHDINLAEPAGQKELQRRIRVATNQVCANADTRAMEACRQLALDHVKAPVASAIARAATSERYAEATPHSGK